MMSKRQREIKMKVSFLISLSYFLPYLSSFFFTLLFLISYVTFCHKMFKYSMFFVAINIIKVVCREVRVRSSISIRKRERGVTRTIHKQSIFWEGTLTC